MTDAATLEVVRNLTDDEWATVATRLLTGCFPTARPDQRRPPGDWDVWVIKSGRGWGKTRTGAEDLVEAAQADPGDYFAAGPTFADARDVMVEGPSGLLAVLRRRCIGHTWNRSLGEIVLSNGSRIKAGSADEPDRWRGWNFRGGWADELAAWRRPDTWTQLRLATRIGEHPRIVVTTTPRPTSLFRSLIDQQADGSVHVTSGRTWDNAENLSNAALAELRRRYEGTRIGRQELEGELLLDVPGALWTRAMLDAAHADVLREGWVRAVVAVDPAVTASEDSDETGIVAAARSADAHCPLCGAVASAHFVVLADRSGRHTPDGWANAAISLYDEVQGDRLVAEVNNGGDLVERVVRQVDAGVPYRAVRASRGKQVRAEPVAALYEQGRVHHVGDLAALEDQLVSWTPDLPSSPDRLDALVWAVTELMDGQRGRRRLVVA